MLKRNQLGKRYLRESDGKITEDDIRDYIYGVAQSTFDNLDFEIDYAITHNHWNDLDLIEDGEVDAEMLPVRIDLKDDYALEYKAVADWVDDIYYTYDFDMYAYVSKDFVLANINGDDIGEKGYRYETIEFSFGDGGSIKDVYMNDASTITKEIYTRLEQSLKNKGIYDLVGQPKVELNESRSKINKRRNMIRESNYILPNQKDILNGADDVASGFVYLMEDMLKSSSYDYEDGDEMYFTLGYASSARSNEIDEFFEENGVYDISVKTYPSDKKGKTFFHDTTFESSEFTENFSGGLTFDELKRKIVAGIMKHLEKKLGAYFPESRSKLIRSKRGLSKKALFEKKLTKEFVMGGIKNIADMMAEDMIMILSQDAENIDNGENINEAYGSYYFDPHYYNSFSRYLSMYKEWIGVAVQWNYKEDKDGHIDFDFSDAKIGFGESDYILHDSFNPKSTSHKDIKQEIIDYLKEALVNLGYLDEALVESKFSKRLSKRSLKESKRKSFRGGQR